MSSADLPDPEGEPRPLPQGWLTSDADEVERRRRRGREDGLAIEPLGAGLPVFGAFAVRSGSGVAYRVEIRSLTRRINSCDCPDWRINGLGTCKHVEGVLHRLRRAHPEAFVQGAESPRAEVYVDPAEATLRAARPAGLRSQVLAPFFGADGRLLGDPLDALPALLRALEEAPAELRAQVRVSTHIQAWLAPRRRRAERQAARKAFLKDVAAGKRSLDVLSVPLYPYQRDGMLHLAFGERALLADEMGLGKTLQAIAACVLLRQLRAVERVLVVCPVSVKAEWEEQIARCCALPTLMVQGQRPERARQYRQSAFFYLANYEQVVADREALQELLAPDVIVLDEAQRIKNWRTRTAEAVKRLDSRYAFVLTGTPLESRIDEVYSIVQFLDPALFGPLFRFNRDFYELDEKGRPVGVKNLPELHRRLRHVMLRRRKDEVGGELPARTVNQYVVPMHPEQRARYDEHGARLARLLAAAGQRPLAAGENEQLTRHLACMRMLCDTPYILDGACKVSPKLDELAHLLPELLEGGHKAILFSEWERMLELVRELAEGLGVGHAWHTGSLPQARRREAIDRFKTDPGCRLLLSTDAGSTGLNLQATDVVVNLDLPWNPARLEQRIARAWRRQQDRPVQVINLVSEDSIEQRLLHALEAKRGLAAGALDGEGEARMDLPGGQADLVQRLAAIMGRPLPRSRGQGAGTGEQAAPPERLRQDLLARLPGRLDLLRVGPQGAVLVVLDRLDEADHALVVRLAAQATGEARLEVIDRAAYATLRRLAEAGLASLAEGTTLHRSQALAGEDPARLRRLAAARERLEAARRKGRMAQVLVAGGFVLEALDPMARALEGAREALAGLGEALPEPGETLLASLGEGADPDTARERLAQGERVLAAVEARLGARGRAGEASPNFHVHPPPSASSALNGPG